MAPPLSRARLSGAGPLEGVGRGLARGGAGPPDLRDLVGARPCGLLQPGLICALPAGSSNCDRGFFITSWGGGGKGAQPSPGPAL